MHWLSGRSLSCNDLHVFKPIWQSWWESIVLGPKATSSMIHFFASLLLNNCSFSYFTSFWVTVHHMQVVLLLLSVIAVPWMLFPKPFMLKKLHNEVPLLPPICVILFLENWERCSPIFLFACEYFYITYISLLVWFSPFD